MTSHAPVKCQFVAVYWGWSPRANTLKSTTTIPLSESSLCAAVGHRVQAAAPTPKCRFNSHNSIQLASVRQLSRNCSPNSAFDTPYST